VGFKIESDWTPLEAEFNRATWNTAIAEKILLP
jgi:hypothetical protein